MKKIVLVSLAFLLIFTATKAQYVNIPDSNFRKGLIQYYPGCFNAAGQMDTTCAGAINNPYIVFGYNAGISSIEGIQYFKELKDLFFPKNQLTSLPSLPPKITYITINDNLLTTLPKLPDSLTTLICDNNLLTTLPQLPNSIVNLYCNHNKLIQLPSIPPKLYRLECQNNKLTQLPSNTFSNGLADIYCGNNYITSLPNITKPNGNTAASLMILDCNNNMLTSLPDFNDALSLFKLVIYGNNITCLPLMQRLPYFQASGTYGIIRLDTSKIHCIPGLNSASFYSDSSNIKITIPSCNPTNNPNQCQSYPIINGNVFNDNNSNNIKDGNESYRRNIKVQLSNGDYATTNDSGYFEMAADSIGAYTLTIKTPNLYNAFPASIINYNFSRYDTLVTSSIALQPTAIKDSLSIKINSFLLGAKQGKSLPYLISYENVGTTILNPNISFNYDASKLDYDSSDASVTNTGNSLSLNINNFVPGQQNKFIVYFTVKTNAVIGDTVKSNAVITGGSATATDNVYNIIRSSFDPNDKTATPELTTAELVNGKYIDYTIRFQNTGNDTAFNVVLADSLSSKLQSNSLEMVASSHNCKATVKAGVAYFEFLNINLVDSVHNEKGSHGFVRFKIKPKATLIAGDSINNKASIYFDYNSAVVTNTATTKIKNPIIVPLKLLSFDGNALENGNNLLYWNTTNEINTQSFIIQQSIDGRVFASIGEVKAKGNGEYRFTDNRVPLTADRKPSTVFYRLMIRDNDGSFTFSKIIVIKSEIRNQKFEILSNPVKNELVISSISNSLMNTEATLINSNGIVVKRFVLNGSNQIINVSSLSNGIYYLLTVEGSRKLIINN